MLIFDKLCRTLYNYNGKGAKYMMEEKIQLTPNDIYEHQFKLDVRGYSPQEVDKFLDIIMSDYTEFGRVIPKYKNEIKALMDENTALRNEIRNLKSTLSVAETNKGVTNVDILRRLGELEKIVYGEEHKD